MSGQEVSGTREAPDRFTLARELRGEGLVVVNAFEKPAGGARRWLSWSISFGRVKTKDLIIFTNNLGSMLSAGLSLSRALSVLSRQTGNKYFKRTIIEIEERIGKGGSLSQSLAAYSKIFPDFFVAMVASAEESGKLAEALKLVGEQLEKSYGLQRKIMGALLYPAVIVMAIAIVGALMMIFLIPTLSATFKELNVPLPLSTRLVISLSDFLVNHILSVSLSIVAVLSYLIYFLRTKRGRRLISWTMLRLPFIKDLTRQANSATVLRSLSSLISAGVSMTRTIEVTIKVVQNQYYQEVLTEALGKIQKGLPLSNVLTAHQNLFPIFAGEMAAVGEETGRLADLLLKGAEFFEDEVNQVTKNLSTIIEPLLMIIIGIAVGFFAVSMIGPMYSLSNAI